MTSGDNQKSFDVTDQMRATRFDELAGASQPRPEPEVNLDEARTVFPVSFDKGTVGKDFRPEEVQDSQLVPKDSSAPVSVFGETLTTGLEDVSAADLLNEDMSESEPTQQQPQSPPMPPLSPTTTG